MRTVWAGLWGVCLLSVLAVAVRGAETIRIGTLFAETGPAAFLGAPEARTVRMLADQVNARGGIGGRKVELVMRDTKGDPATCVSFAKQMIDEERVLAIIGPSTSGETMQIKDLCERNRVILFSCAAAEVIVNPVARYVFKSPQKDSQAASWIFMAMKERGLTRAALLSDNSGFGSAGKKQVEELAPKAGIEIVISEVYDARATDLTDILAKVKAKDVQAVINWSIVPAQSIVPKNMRQLDMTMPLFQSHGFGNIKYVEMAGAAAEGILFPAGRLLVADVLPDTHPQKAVLTRYKRDYEAAFHEPVSTFGGHAYDAFMIVMAAVEKAGVDPEKVRDAIESTQGFVGTGGIFYFSREDHNGLGLEAFELLTVKDGKFVPAKP